MFIKRWMLKSLLVASFCFYSPIKNYAFAQSVLFFGDSGMGNDTQKSLAKVMKNFCDKNKCDFALGLGDNIYPKGVSSVDDPQFVEKFENIYCPLGIKFFMSLGNHDYDGNVDAQIQYTERSKCWWMPARYYQFSKGNVDFFAIDTESHSFSQVEWLRSALSNSKANWKVVFGHRPLFSFGSHGDTYELWTWLLPLVKFFNVDFYLSGHDHIRQIIPGRGIQYIVSGAAADPKKDVKQKNGTYSFAKGGAGFSHIQFGDSSAIIRMIDAEGNIDYQSEISK